MADLAGEAAAYFRNIGQPHLDHLASLGVPLSAIAHLGRVQTPIGATRVLWRSGGTWEPDPDGEPALIVPVEVPDYFEVWNIPCESSRVVDMVALRTTSPGRWAWRTGIAWGLREDLLTEPDGEPVPVVANPIAWLAGGGEALCILDWSKDSPVWQYLRAGPDLLVEHDHLRARIADALRRSIPLPAMRLHLAAA